MKKIFYFLLAVLFINNTAFSQIDTLSVKVENQYESEIGDAKITVLRTGKSFMANQKGVATIEATANDSVRIDKESYSTNAISLKGINKKNIITVKKEFTWKDLLTPMFYIINGGLWLILFIIFAETGLFAGFFLPGDSLLFVAGIFSNSLAAYLYDTNNDFLNLLLIISLVTIAGVLGNATGYWFGKKVGPTMYGWKNNLLFKQKYLLQAHDFYEKHGGGAIVFARFLPIVRTFAPIVAGIVKMDRKKFGFYNVAGCIAWATVMLAAGHYLDKLFIEKFDIDLKKHLEVIVIVIVVVTTAPVLIKMLGGRKK